MPKFKKIREIKSNIKKIDKPETKEQIEKSNLEEFIKEQTNRLPTSDTHHNFEIQGNQKQIFSEIAREEFSVKNKPISSEDNGNTSPNYFPTTSVNREILTEQTEPFRKSPENLITSRENQIQQNNAPFRQPNAEEKKYEINQKNQFEKEKSRRWRM